MSPRGHYHIARPLWANGAFIYCTEKHSEVLMDALGHGTADFGLKSKHIVVSPCYLELVNQALADVSLMEGRRARELYQASRAVFKSRIHLSLHNFLKLAPAALALPDVDNDLLEYATCPESVQSMPPDNWWSIFDICCTQNPDFIVVRGSTFYCRPCDTVISCRHLASLDAGRIGRVSSNPVCLLHLACMTQF